MRAERLLAVLMLLKSRGRMTARAIADELGVSERTVLRDIDSLSVSGVPVYSERGRHGGFALVPGYRTDLTGLTLEEATTLVAGAARIESPPLAAAMRKIAAALPDSHRDNAFRAAQRILVRPEGFIRPPQPIEGMAEVRQAVFEGRRIRVRYQARGARTDRERLLDPIGLILAGDTWYLVALADGNERMYRMSRMSDIEVLDDPARRASEVDLEAIWQTHRDRFRAGFVVVPVTIRCAPGLLPWLAEAAIEIGDHEVVGVESVEVVAGFVGVEHAVERLWGFGQHVEVMAPDEVRTAIVARLAALRDTYAADLAADGVVGVRDGSPEGAGSQLANSGPLELGNGAAPG